MRVDHLTEALRGPDSEFLHGDAQIGGVRLHFVQEGSGNKLILLLHGFPQCWYAWRHQLKAFGEGYTVVAPDLRGYGLSDRPAHKSDYEISNLVDDVTGLIRHLGFSQATVVGHDWGAGIAWAVALAHPEYVTKLVAMQVPPLDIWIKNLTVGQALRSWYMLFFQLPYLPELWIRARDFYGLERMFKTTTARPNVFTDADIAVYKDALRESGALTAAINYYRANFIRMFVKRGQNHKQETGRRIPVPTLFLFGEQDFAIERRTVQGVAELINAPYREVRFAQSGHWVQEELPLEVNKALVEFVEG